MAESNTTICNNGKFGNEGSGIDIASDITRNLTNMSIVLPKSSVCMLEGCVSEACTCLYVQNARDLLTIHVLTCHPTKFISSQGKVIGSMSATTALAIHQHCALFDDVVSEKIDNLNNTITSVIV